MEKSSFARFADYSVDMDMVFRFLRGVDRLCVNTSLKGPALIDRLNNDKTIYPTAERQQVFTEHMTQIAKKPIWKTLEGNMLAPATMETSHLINCVNQKRRVAIIAMNKPTGPRWHELMPANATVTMACMLYQLVYNRKAVWLNATDSRYRGYTQEEADLHQNVLASCAFHTPDKIGLGDSWAFPLMYWLSHLENFPTMGRALAEIVGSYFMGWEPGTFAIQMDGHRNRTHWMSTMHLEEMDRLTHLETLRDTIARSLRHATREHPWFHVMGGYTGGEPSPEFNLVCVSIWMLMQKYTMTYAQIAAQAGNWKLATFKSEFSVTPARQRVSVYTSIRPQLELPTRNERAIE